MARLSRLLLPLAGVLLIAACTGPMRPKQAPHITDEDRKRAGAALVELETDFPLRVISPARIFEQGELRDALASVAEPRLRKGCLQATRGQYEFFDLPGEPFTVTILLFASKAKARKLFRSEGPTESCCPLLGDENHRSDEGIVFYRGPYHVSIIAESADTRWHKQALLFASQLDESLAGR